MTPENKIKILEEENRKMRAMLWPYTTADGICGHCGKDLCCLTSGFKYCHWCGKSLKSKSVKDKLCNLGPHGEPIPKDIREE